MLKPDSLRAERVLVFQSVTTLALAVAGFFVDAAVALSAFIGGATGTAANAVFAFWVFKRYRAQQPGELVMRFYGAEMIKIVLILAVFVLAFVLVEDVNVPALLGAYFIIQVVPALVASGAG